MRQEFGEKDPKQYLLLKGVKGTSKEEAFKTIRQKQPKFDVDSLAESSCSVPVLILPKLPALEPLKVCWQSGFCTQTLVYWLLFHPAARETSHTKILRLGERAKYFSKNPMEKESFMLSCIGLKNFCICDLAN